MPNGKCFQDIYKIANNLSNLLKYVMFSLIAECVAMDERAEATDQLWIVIQELASIYTDILIVYSSLIYNLYHR